MRHVLTLTALMPDAVNLFSLRSFALRYGPRTFLARQIKMNSECYLSTTMNAEYNLGMKHLTFHVRFPNNKQHV